MTSTTYCDNCGLAIQWGRTKNERPMPVELAASDEGNIVFHDDGVRIDVLTVKQLAEPVTRPRFMSHFATCSRYSK